MSQLRINSAALWLSVSVLLVFTSLRVTAQEPVSTNEAALRMQADVRQWVFSAIGPANSAMRARLQGQVEAMVGREDMQPPTRQSLPSCEPLSADPLALIAEEARKTNIVIINESHSSSRERHFIREVLRVLRQQGFDTYAAETFTHSDLNHAGALGSDGWYSNEPIFGRTISTAKSLGYKLVAYEQTNPQEQSRAAMEPQESEINRREWNQANNLVTAIFSKSPESKVVIHAGGQHVQERRRTDRQDPNVWMAERLKLATGKDPLTINQGACGSPGSTPVVARNRLGNDGSVVDWNPVDLYIGHPKLTLLDGRPDWRQRVGDKKQTMPAPFAEMAEPVIVEARAENTSLTFVPVDRVLLLPGERLPLLLPPGSYRVDGFTRGGRVPIDAIIVQVR